MDPQGLSLALFTINRWLTVMDRLFHPQVVELIKERDRTIAEWTPSDNATNVVAGGDLEITSPLEISPDNQMQKSVSPLARQSEQEFARGLG